MKDALLQVDKALTELMLESLDVTFDVVRRQRIVQQALDARKALGELLASLPQADPVLDTSINDLPITRRCWSALNDNKLLTVGDITKISWKECRRLSRVGKKTLAEITTLLHDMGLNFRKH